VKREVLPRYSVQQIGFDPYNARQLMVAFIKELLRGRPASYRGGTAHLPWVKRPSPVFLAASHPRSLSAAGAKKASAVLVVRFVVKSKGETRYDKQVRQDAKWDSSFVGAIAIPDAINHYSEQFRLILLRLYRDPEFLKALRPAAKVATSGDATREAAPAT